VKGVYTGSPEKMSAVGEIMEDVIGRLQQEAGLHDDGPYRPVHLMQIADLIPSDSIAPPTALLWAYYYLALHLSYPLHPNPSFARSLELLSLALEHTPTLPEVYMARAMVLKRAGDPLGAAEAMEDARLLDGQDRFLNGKAAKYWLRAGDVKQAEDLVALFTKVREALSVRYSADWVMQKDTNAVLDLTDLQCLWFLQEEGDAHRRNGNLAMALKRYQALADVRISMTSRRQHRLTSPRYSKITRTINTTFIPTACAA
jgi:tetratricopeptide (TPR) repeat protein